VSPGFVGPAEGSEAVGRPSGETIGIATPSSAATDGLRLGVPKYCDDGESVLTFGVNGSFVGTAFSGFDEETEGSDVGLSFKGTPGDVTFGTTEGHADASPLLGKSDGDEEVL
jgi:hypothetical protein